MTCKPFIVLLITFILPTIVVAQIKLKLAGKTFVIPNFKADSAESFDSYLVKDHNLPSIKKSRYDLEIRFIPSGGFGSQAREACRVIIKGNKDSLYAEDYLIKDLSGYNTIPDGFNRFDSYSTPQ